MVPLEKRHRPSGLNTLFNESLLVKDRCPIFADYVAQTRGMLMRAHAGVENLEKIVDGNAPFELKPPSGFLSGKNKTYRRGVLLTHGLSDSPYLMRHLAAFFQQNGFRVFAVLLPGHGTQPGDLLEVSWREWSKTVAYGAYRLAEEVDEVYLAGYSTGAMLSLYQALRDSRVCGLFLFSPALKITRWAAFAKLHKLYSWLLPSAKWVDVKPDLDIYKYESFTRNAAAQAYALIGEVNRHLRKVELHIPVFIAASEDDMTVDISAVVAFMKNLCPPPGKLVLYSTQPEKIPHDLSAGKLERVNSVFPGQKILSSAHTAIVVSPEDSHYGPGGDYSNCVHYYPHEMEKYAACMTHPEQNYQGELSVKNLSIGIMQRLMYNPNFAALKISLQRFIRELP